jgi:trehalose 6-phosphate synthase/phosphatase
MILDDEKEKELVSDYRESNKRLILLDYDGTLTPFFDRPEDASPTEDVLKLLEKLAADPKNELVLISGRSRNNIEKWFEINASYVAGHGAWIKEKGKGWEIIEPLRNDWKKEIRPILERYVDRTPGSSIEEKKFSLAWHYRNVDPESRLDRIAELADDLKIIASLNLQILEENHVIEVINAGINKGRAASRWTGKKDWDFILAMGDDWTDEDTFSVLPKTAYTIKVGPRPSQARFSLDSYPFVLWLLKELVERDECRDKNR